MRFTFLLPVVALACSPPHTLDGGVPDAGHDAGPGGGLDGGSDAGSDAGQPPYTGCTCGDAGACGTGALGDPLRCCNYQQDSCGAQDAGPCGLPVRCSPKPPCCFDGTCRASVTCGSGLCKSWLGAATPDEGTACDDGRACSFAVPAVSLPDCVGTDAGADGDDCGSDRVTAFPTESSCPREAPVCSALRSGFGGNGGVMQGGRCCPSGMACDFRAGATHLKCLGNFGRGLNSNDVCRAGVCSADDTSTCP